IIFLLKEVNIINDKSESNYFNSNYRIRTRGFLKIQDGCDNYCSYCIIPYLRGNLRSKPINDIISEFKDMIHKGYKEIVLVGIHLGKYGIDIGTSLLDLLKILVQVEGEFRIRLSSLEVNEIKEELTSLIKENNKICPHLHIPLQSGSNRILERMNRKYSSEEFVEIVSSIRSELPLLRIGLDVIVGFPGESIDDFNETAAVIDIIKPDYMHIFPYSDRVGTKAYNMKDKVPKFDIKARAAKLRDLANKLEIQSYQKMIGKYARVLLENESTGYSDNYFKVKSANYYKENTFKEFYIDKFDRDNKLLIGSINS
ncbi:MAG: MiaB/RimO family radical SAM methylthiotransferase, partial [Deferribacterota bacterium]|nr:MiaB/RimO family radical SAM methylthiotransferase [Deferribacterota bacterium]